MKFMKTSQLMHIALSVKKLKLLGVELVINCIPVNLNNIEVF